ALARNQLRCARLVELLEAPDPGPLSWLDLSGNDLGNNTARLLADSAVLSQLRGLELRNTRISGKGLVALLDSPHLGNLVWPDLHGSQCTLQDLLAPTNCRRTRRVQD